MKTLVFTQVDVFTARPLEGNPLAVFHSGAGLSTARMQAIAREMNLAETTFLLPAAPAKADARVRIFTTTEELPFAGHPTLGTAFVVGKTSPGETTIRLQMKVGVIPVTLQERAAGAYLEMQQNEPIFGARIDRKRLAAALRIGASDLDARFDPQVVSTGLPFAIVPIRRRSVLLRLAPDYEQLFPLIRKAGAHFPYFIVTGERDLEARMFAPTFEDPATGSAGGCATAYLVRCGRCRPDTPFVIRQGEVIHRPSRIYGCASLADGTVRNVRVGGHVVEVLEGQLRL
jgi:trans-2,3-dihydro-3-hydroxyanthranilate isomerase